MKIVKLTPTEIIVIDSMGNTMNGSVINSRHLDFLHFCNIDITKYNVIYFLNDKKAGSYFFINGDKYRYIQCGSGRPIILDHTGDVIVKA